MKTKDQILLEQAYQSIIESSSNEDKNLVGYLRSLSTSSEYTNVTVYEENGTTIFKVSETPVLKVIPSKDPKNPTIQVLDHKGNKTEEMSSAIVDNARENIKKFLHLTRKLEFSGAHFEFDHLQQTISMINDTAKPSVSSRFWGGLKSVAHDQLSQFANAFKNDN